MIIFHVDNELLRQLFSLPGKFPEQEQKKKNYEIIDKQLYV